MRAYHAVLALIISACGSESARSTAQPPTCVVTDATRLSGAGFGALRIGATVDAVRSVCSVLRDTTLLHGNEGLPERRIAVLVGRDTVAATVVNGLVWRVELTTSAIRTIDSLGVGTTAGQLRARGATLAVGDRGVFAILPSHCGLSFRLGGVDVSQGQSWSGVPDSAPVVMVLAYGCEARATS